MWFPHDAYLQAQKLNCEVRKKEIEYNILNHLQLFYITAIET